MGTAGNEDAPTPGTIAMIGAGNMGQALAEAIYSAQLFEGTRFFRAFNLKAAFSFPSPGEVDAADDEMPWTTNDESVRPVAEALIRAAGGTPAYEGGLENAREY